MATDYKTFQDDARPTPSAPPPPYQSSPNPPPPYPGQPYQHCSGGGRPSHQQHTRQLWAGRVQADNVVLIGRPQLTTSSELRLNYYCCLAIVLFFPLGILACKKLNKVHERLNEGDIEGARKAASQTKLFSSLAVAVFAAAIIITAIVVVSFPDNDDV